MVVAASKNFEQCMLDLVLDPLPATIVQKGLDFPNRWEWKDLHFGYSALWDP